VVKFYNGRGNAEQHIKEGKNALRWTRLSCHAFPSAVRLQLHALAYNLANFLRTLALAAVGRALVPHEAAREAGEDQREDRAPRPLRGIPAGRAGGGAGAVRQILRRIDGLRHRRRRSGDDIESITDSNPRARCAPWGAPMTESRRTLRNRAAQAAERWLCGTWGEYRPYSPARRAGTAHGGPLGQYLLNSWLS
jgi:hypothetical protein